MASYGLLDRIEAEEAARVMDECGHLGLGYEVLCAEPAPVTWFMDGDGATWVVAHHPFDPEHGVPEGIVRRLGLTVVQKCPAGGERLGWCCCHATRRDRKPGAQEAARRHNWHGG